MSGEKDNYEQINMTFVLFSNQFKKADKQPDVLGTITVEGKKYKMSGWKKESKGGKSYISGTVQTEEQFYHNQPSAGEAAKKKETRVVEQVPKEKLKNDEVPF